MHARKTFAAFSLFVALAMPQIILFGLPAKAERMPNFTRYAMTAGVLAAYWCFQSKISQDYAQQNWDTAVEMFSITQAEVDNPVTQELANQMLPLVKNKEKCGVGLTFEETKGIFLPLVPTWRSKGWID